MQLEQPSKTLEDFSRAADLDENNSDVYHHRGQVHYLCLLLKITVFKLYAVLKHSILNIIYILIILFCSLWFRSLVIFKLMLIIIIKLIVKNKLQN